MSCLCPSYQIITKIQRFIEKDVHFTFCKMVGLVLNSDKTQMLVSGIKTRDFSVKVVNIATVWPNKISAIKPQNQTKYKIRQVAVHQSLFMRASRRLLCFIFSSRQKQWLLCPNLLNMMGKAPVHIAGEDEKSIGSSPALHAQQSGIYHNDKYL